MKTLKFFTALAFILASASLNAQQGGYALHFDGTNDYANCGAGTAFNITGTAITIEAWINTSNINQTWQAIGGKQNAPSGAYSLIIEGSNKKPAFWLATTSSAWGSKVIATTVLQQDQWYHIAGTYDGSNARIYVNGKLENSATLTGNIVSLSTVPVYIGRNSDVYFNGMIDEFRIWNSTRTEADIKANMHKEIGTHTNLKAYYKMSEGTGTSLTDNSGNVNTGTLTNGPSWNISGCFAGSRQALDFDGTNDYVDIGNNASLKLTTAVTVEAWIYPTYLNPASVAENVIFERSGNNGYGYQLRCGGNGNIDFIVGGTGWTAYSAYAADNTLSLNKWFHVAGTYDKNAGKIILYVNGIEVATGSTNIYMETSGTSFNANIARSAQFNTRIFKGLLDEVRVWNYARSENEIRQNWLSTLAANETGLVGYWRFDQNDGTTLYDMTTNGNNGTLTNMDAATDWVASSAFNTWLGGESNAWATARNWSNGVPSSANSAGIFNWNSALPNVTTNLPVLPATLDVNNLLVPSGVSSAANVNLTASASVFLGSNLTLSPGVLNSAKNLAIENGKTLTIPTSGQLTVSNALANSAGNTGLLIESGGSLIHNSNSVAATVKREIAGSSSLTEKKYHFVSIPTQYASPTSNLFLGSYLYTLDPNQLNENSSYGKWVGLGTSTTTLLANENGYMVYYPDASTTYTFEGNLNNGTFNYSLNGHVGAGVYTFNLIPNPYPSAVKWNTAGTGWTESAGVGGTCYIWDASTGNYSNIASSETSYIPAGQALMVAVSNESSPTLSVNNNARIHSTQAFYKSVSEVENQLVIKANANNYADETVVKFAENATEVFDLQIDGLKINGLEDAPQLCTRIDETRFSINNLPALQGQRIVDMNFSTQFAGQITFSASGIESFDPSINIYLKDEFVNQTINLRNQTVYTFNHNPANDANRFKLIFGGTYGVAEKESLAGNMWIAGNILYINTPKLTGEKALVEIYNAAGQRVFSKQIALSQLTQVPTNLSGFAVVRVSTEKDVWVTKGIF